MSKLTIVTGRSGSGKTEYCLTEISELLEQNPLGESLILIVPEQASFQMEKALAQKIAGQGFIGAQIFGFRRFSYRILQEVGGNWLPSLSDSGRQLVLGKILRRRKEELLSLGKAASKPRFADTLSELIQEFRTQQISPSELRNLAETLENPALNNKLLDLSLLYQDFMDFLENRYRDSTEALDQTSLSIPSCDWLNGAHIWIDGFDRFSPQEWQIISALLDKADQITITLCLEDPEKSLSHNDVFYRPGQTFFRLQRLGIDKVSAIEKVHLPIFHRSLEKELIHLESHLYGFTSPFVEPTSQVQVQSAPNPRQEIVGIARQMINQVRFQGYRWRDLAILLRQEEPYRNLIESVFTEYQIPFYRDQNVTPLHHPTINLLCSTFDVMVHHWLPEPIFQTAKTGLFPIDEDQLDQLENYVLEFGIKGKSRWAQEEPWKFARRYALEEDTLPDEEEILRLDQINQSRKILATPLLLLEKRWKDAATVKEKTIALYEYWEELNLDSKLEELALFAENADDPETARLHRQIGSEIRSLLDELVDLLGEEAVSLTEYSKLIIDGLEALSIRLIPPGLDHVEIHTLPSILPATIQAAYIPGVNDGLFPSRCRPEGLLSEMDRLLLQDGGLELAPSNLSEAYNERLVAYRALTSPSRYLWLSYSLATADGSGLSPSLLISRIREIFPALSVHSLKLDDGIIASDMKNSLFRENLAFVDLATYLRRLRDGERENTASYWSDVYNYFLSSPERKSPLTHLTRNLLGKNDATLLSSDLAHALYAPQNKLRGSVTRLETFQTCPFKHFAQYGLRLKERPEFKLSPPQVGVFLHGALKRYGQELLEKKENWHDLTPTQRKSLIEEIVLELAKKLQNEILFSSSQYQYFMRRLTEVVERSVEHLTAFSAVTAFTPVALEQSFGSAEEGWPSLRFDLGGSLSLEISGQIDRIDAASTGEKTYLLVIDYKSGSQKLSFTKVFHGLSLQLLTYLLVALEGAKNLTDDSRPYEAGVLYYFLKNPLLAKEGPVDPEVIRKDMENALRMPGWLLKDPSLIELLETTFEEEKTTQFVPTVQVKNDGEFYKSSEKNLKSSEDFSLILDHLKSILIESGQKILEGNLQINPYKLKNAIPCTFCNYKAFCGFDRFQGNTYRELGELSENEILNQLKKGDSTDDSMDS